MARFDSQVELIAWLARFVLLLLFMIQFGASAQLNTKNNQIIEYFLACVVLEDSLCLGAKKDHSGRPQSAANGDVYVNGDSATAKSELRHRKHSETAAKIAEIKKNMKKHESDQEFWSNYWPHFFGIGVLVLGSCAYFYMRTHDSRFFS